MSEALPAPLAPPDCDCTDLDGFMLNVERLMASELVALASHEAIAAALFLWCRAWKQKPAASLPDDDRVVAAFARLPVARFRKLKADILHGFIKCSDGRLYHRVLAVEVVNAYERKLAFQKRRNGDAERLRKWRETQRETRVETAGETAGETPNETRFVAEGQGQGQGQGHIPPLSPVSRNADAGEPGDIDDVRKVVWRQQGLTEDRIGTLLASASRQGVSRVKSWLDLGFTAADLIALAERAWQAAEDRGEPVRDGWSWLDGWVVREAEKRAKPPPAEPDPVADWRVWVMVHLANEAPWQFPGPPPGAPGCQVPAVVLREFEAELRRKGRWRGEVAA